MSNRRQQHRNQRETSNREKRELEQENRRLKREVSRLRKELERSPEEFDDDESAPEESKSTQPKCPECAGALTSITTPSGKIRHACRTCQWRGTL